MNYIDLLVLIVSCFALLLAILAIAAVIEFWFKKGKRTKPLSALQPPRENNSTRLLLEDGEVDIGLLQKEGEKNKEFENLHSQIKDTKPWVNPRIERNEPNPKAWTLRNLRTRIRKLYDPD